MAAGFTLSGRTRAVVLAVAVAGLAVPAGAAFTPVSAAMPGTPPGWAGPATLVPEKVRTNLPKILDGAVSDITQVGNRIIVGGTFTQVSPGGGAPVVTQKYLMAYDLETGAFDAGFRPVLDGAVEAVEASSDGTALYVGGAFNSVSGTTRRKLAKLRADGSLDTTFVADASSKVSAIAVSAKRIWVGGKFTSIGGKARGGLAALDAATGGVKANFNLPIQGGIGYAGELSVKGLGITPDVKTLVVSYTGQTIGGVSRVGLATVDLSGPIAVVSPWHTTLFQDGLAARGGQLWLRGFDISPDGSYFVVTTSGGDAPPINDMVIAFPVAGDEGVQPRWLSRHFDSVYSAAIDTSAIYIGGHFRYQEAPGSTEPYPGDPTAQYSFSTGPNGIGAGVLGSQVLSRLQLGALDPATGTSLPWNPGSDAFNGVTALTVVPRGLLLGHDGTVVAGKSVGRMAFFDRTLAKVEAVDSSIVSPTTGQVLTAGQQQVIRGTAVAQGGVAKVQVTVQNRRDKTYLQANGTWATAWAALTATIEAPGAQVNWSVTATIPGGAFDITSRSFAVNGVKEADQPLVKVDAFDPFDAAPVTKAVSVTMGGADGRTVELHGTATDDRGVAGVKLALRNRTANAHLQPNGTLGSYYEFDAVVDQPGATGVNWSFTAALPDGQWYVQAKAIDVAGQRDGTGGTIAWDVFPNNAAPTVTLATPTANATIATETRVQLTGTATDDHGVASVQVNLLNQSTGQGLVGADVIGDRATWIVTTLGSPNATSTTWSLTTPPLPAGRYQLQVMAVDSGTQQTVGTARPSITFDVSTPGDARPTSTITSPSTAQITDPNLTIAGNATDDRGVNAALVRIYTSAAPAGWLKPDGTIDTTTPHWFTADLATPGATSSGWSLPITLPRTGTWTIYTYSVDLAGQPSNQVAYTTRYTVNDNPPTVTVATPTQNQTLLDATTVGVNGTVEDDHGVDRVRVYLFRNPFSEGPNPAAGVNAPGWYDAFVTNPGGTRSNWIFTTPVLARGPWRMYVTAVDSAGLSSALGIVDFVVGVTGDANPNVSIDTPKYGATDFTSTTFNLAGQTTDDKGVASVVLRMARRDGLGWLKPDGTYTPRPAEADWPTTLAAPGAPTSAWSAQVTVPAGGYNIYAIVTDSAGQRQLQYTFGQGKQAAVEWVSPGDSVPTVTISAPTANTSVGGRPLTVTGTATDDKGVTNVQVLIRTVADRTQGYRADGTIGAAQYVPAVMSSPGATSTNWTLTAQIPPGTWEIYVYATDVITHQGWATALNLTIT